MARKSVIAAARPQTGSTLWRVPAIIAVLALLLIVMGRCAGRTVDLQDRKQGAAVTVDATGIQTWGQFFACYPLPDAYVKVAVMRQYASGDAAGRPPSRVRIPLEADGKAISASEAGWLTALRTETAVCPVTPK
jgi:hypothetical protein